MPKTLTKTNTRILSAKLRNQYGDRNTELYLSARNYEKKNKDSEEYWFEKQAAECSFRPNTTKAN